MCSKWDFCSHSGRGDDGILWFKLADIHNGIIRAYPEEHGFPHLPGKGLEHRVNGTYKVQVICIVNSNPVGCQADGISLLLLPCHMNHTGLYQCGYDIVSAGLRHVQLCAYLVQGNAVRFF